MVRVILGVYADGATEGPFRPLVRPTRRWESARCARAEGIRRSEDGGRTARRSDWWAVAPDRSRDDGLGTPRPRKETEGDHVNMPPTNSPTPPHHLRYLARRQHLVAAPFGSGSFGARAEAFARFFGTPRFLIGQTIVVGAWIAINAIGLVHFDLYPFILLNLAFSLQAAYAAPLILLAQTRQADRDKAHAEADAEHREALAQAAIERQALSERQLELLKTLLDDNTRLTSRVEALTQEIHGRILDTATTPAEC